jgi:hypothetical protein
MKNYERICQECGYTWQVPGAVARRGKRGVSGRRLLRGLGQSGFGQPGPGGIGQTGGPLHTDLQGSVAAQSAAMESYRICAKCGVEKFTQRPAGNS